MTKCTHFKCTFQYALTNLYTCETTSYKDKNMFITPKFPLSLNQVIPIPILAPGGHWSTFCYYTWDMLFVEFHINGIGHNVLLCAQILSCFCVYQSCILFCCRVVFHCKNTIYPYTYWWILMDTFSFWHLINLL